MSPCHFHVVCCPFAPLLFRQAQQRQQQHAAGVEERVRLQKDLERHREWLREAREEVGSPHLAVRFGWMPLSSGKTSSSTDTGCVSFPTFCCQSGSMPLPRTTRAPHPREEFFAFLARFAARAGSTPQIEVAAE